MIHTPEPHILLFKRFERPSNFALSAAISRLSKRLPNQLDVFIEIVSSDISP